MRTLGVREGPPSGCLIQPCPELVSSRPLPRVRMVVCTSSHCSHMVSLGLVLLPLLQSQGMMALDSSVWWVERWAWESSQGFRFLLYLFSLCPRARPNIPVPSELLWGLNELIEWKVFSTFHKASQSPVNLALFFLFYRWRNWDSDSVTAKFTQLVCQDYRVQVYLIQSQCFFHPTTQPPWTITLFHIFWDCYHVFPMSSLFPGWPDPISFSRPIAQICIILKLCVDLYTSWLSRSHLSCRAIALVRLCIVHLGQAGRVALPLLQ